MISNEELEQVIREKKSAENELTNEQIEKNVIEWTDFFRKNLDIFNEDYLGIKSSFFQKQRINTMADNEVSIVISSRGSAKSFDVALTAYDFALLYSNCTILITSMTLSQSNNIINEKMDKIFATEGTKWSSPILCQLRKDGWIKFKKDDTTSACYVEFSNGSKVFAVNCGDSARSKRANVVIIDEFVLTKKKDIDEIILPTLEVRKFGGRPEDYPEETKQIFLSSAKNKTNWGWNQLRKCVNGHYKDRTIKYGFFTGDIFTAIANGIQTKKQYIQRKRDTDDISFQQEYLNIFLDNNENSIFKYEDFEECQTLEHPFYPRTVEDILYGEKQSYVFTDDWVRVVICDIALATGNENDNTVFMCMAFNKETGERKFEFIRTIKGMNSLDQVMQMKRLFYEYKTNYFLPDVNGVGATIFDLLTVETEDRDLHITYPAWGVCQDKSLQLSTDTVMTDKIIRTISDKTENVIIPISGNPSFNTQIHLSARKALKDKVVSLLKDDSEMTVKIEDDDPKWLTRSSEYKANLLLPFVQTKYMINEAVSLDTIFTETGNIKLKEAKRTDTKDRYMVFAYANAFADKLYNKYQQGEDGGEFDENSWSWMANSYW